ncbi:MAG: S8 family serine peptidase [Candidatus Delongbacteria bacterium]|jgi:serine protease AprX|nr:S8 family serine peptidase [Candidatus Delongbacteria bacterium]
MKRLILAVIIIFTFNLFSNGFYTAPKENKLSPRAESFINSGIKGDKAFVIYFTDKNIFDQETYEKAISEVEISEKALKRRAKTFKRDDNLVSFSDLPIYQEYIKQLGMENIRSESKWFNFVSAETTADKAIEVSRYNFVRYIDILPPKGKKAEIKSIELNNSKDPRFYGDAYDQVNQINIPAVHDLGYHGEGVTLLIIDTGFKKDHEVFDSLTVIGERDFIFDDNNVSLDSNDVINYQETHGTACWSIAAGYKPNTLVGPAYRSDFLLAKTEDYLNESTLEEDYMVEALEWGEALGADVASISLGYGEFDDPLENYTYEDMDGETTICTLGAKRASYLGVTICNSMGNSGNDPWKYLTAPSDADSIISVGAVDVNGLIASFSSYGPTYDGRIKPEVVAWGVSNYHADYSSTSSYGTGSGTSYSTPLTAGVACLLLSAHPEWTNMEVREAMMMTADRSSNPDTDGRYGWGLIDALAALNYTTGINNTENIITNSQLFNYPNPFNPETIIHYTDLAKNSKISVYNIGGEIISEYSNLSGSGKIRFNADNLPAGVYFCSIYNENMINTIKMLLLK